MYPFAYEALLQSETGGKSRSSSQAEAPSAHLVGRLCAPEAGLGLRGNVLTSTRRKAITDRKPIMSPCFFLYAFVSSNKSTYIIYDV